MMEFAPRTSRQILTIAGLLVLLVTMAGCGTWTSPTALFYVIPKAGCFTWYTGADNGGPPPFTSAAAATQAAAIETASIRRTSSRSTQKQYKHCTMVVVRDHPTWK